MKRLIWLVLILPALASAALAPGDKAYISDRLYLGVYATPGGSDRVALLSSGDALDVVEVQGKYVHVQGGNGIDGWVRGSYLTAQVPASVELAAAQDANAKLKAALADAQERIDTLQAAPQSTTASPQHGDSDRIAALQTRNTQLEGALKSARAQVSALQQKTLRATATPPHESPTGGHVPYDLLLAIAGVALVFGFIWGMSWHRRRLEARFGGLRPR